MPPLMAFSTTPPFGKPSSFEDVCRADFMMSKTYMLGQPRMRCPCSVEHTAHETL